MKRYKANIKGKIQIPPAIQLPWVHLREVHMEEHGCRLEKKLFCSQRPRMKLFYPRKSRAAESKGGLFKKFIEPGITSVKMGMPWVQRVTTIMSVISFCGDEKCAFIVVMIARACEYVILHYFTI